MRLKTRSEDEREPKARIRGGHRRRRLGPTGVWPTLLTLGNLVTGFAAIHYAAKPVLDGNAFGPWGWTSLTVAASLVLLGIVLDSLDGAVARLTDSVTELGGQLDSLADIVTFGLAPAFIMLNLLSQYAGSSEPIMTPVTGNAFGKFCWAVAAIYVCCSALRLARFNVETASGQLGHHAYFRGLPSPGAAGAVVGLVLLHEHVTALATATESSIFNWIAGMLIVLTPVVTLMAAILMVSGVPYAHMANRYLRGARSFTYLVRAGIVLCAAIWWLQETLAIMFMWYLCSGPARVFWKRWRMSTGAMAS